jgi:cytochrome c551
MPENKNSTSFFILFFMVFVCCSTQDNTGEHRLDFKSRIKHQQYVAKGKRHYDQLCANCHQADGSGLGKLYPPLKDSDFMLADVHRTVNIIKNGINGEIVVNGIVYDQEMPPNPKLTHLEISEIAAYVYKRFADTVVLIPPDEVEALLR